MLKRGFTLAEVLITLGIIGVVAAMTIPTVVQSYKKHVVETRLKTFYSTVNQAIIMSETVNEDKKDWIFDNIEEFYNKYIKEYLTTTTVSNSSNCLFVYFNNGSVAQICARGHDWYFYPNAKDTNKPVNGKNRFLFGFYPNYNISGRKFTINNYRNKGLEPYIPTSCDMYDGTLESLMKYCPSDTYTKMIQLNNWKIPKNYPIRF